jgi:hypothetical protein
MREQDLELSDWIWDLLKAPHSLSMVKTMEQGEEESL